MEILNVILVLLPAFIMVYVSVFKAAPWNVIAVYWLAVMVKNAMSAKK